MKTFLGCLTIKFVFVLLTSKLRNPRTVTAKETTLPGIQLSLNIVNRGSPNYDLKLFRSENNFW